MSQSVEKTDTALLIQAIRNALEEEERYRQRRLSAVFRDHDPDKVSRDNVQLTADTLELILNHIIDKRIQFRTNRFDNL